MRLTLQQALGILEDQRQEAAERKQYNRHAWYRDRPWLIKNYPPPPYPEEGEEDIFDLFFGIPNRH